MRRTTPPPLSDQAARRLELLRLELVGQPPDIADPPEPQGPGFPDSVLARGEVLAAPESELPAPEWVEPAVPPAPGRHARARHVGTGDAAAGWVQDRLPGPLAERVRVTSRHLPLLVLLAGAALAAAGWFALRSGESQPVPAARHVAAPAGLPSVASSPTVAASPVGDVVVDVSGRVRHPGIVRAMTNAGWQLSEPGPLTDFQRSWVTRCITIAKAVQD